MLNVARKEPSCSKGLISNPIIRRPYDKQPHTELHPPDVGGEGPTA